MIKPYYLRKKTTKACISIIFIQWQKLILKTLFKLCAKAFVSTESDDVFSTVTPFTVHLTRGQNEVADSVTFTRLDNAGISFIFLKVINFVTVLLSCVNSNRGFPKVLTGVMSLTVIMLLEGDTANQPRNSHQGSALSSRSH